MQFLVGNFAIIFVAVFVSRTRDMQSQGGHKQGEERAHSTSRLPHCAGRNDDKKFIRETGLSAQHTQILCLLPAVSFA